MRVYYKPTIIELIQKESRHAVLNGLLIDHIALNPKEWDELRNMAQASFVNCNKTGESTYVGGIKITRQQS